MDHSLDNDIPILKGNPAVSYQLLKFSEFDKFKKSVYARVWINFYYLKINVL